jgi:inosine/xanthosine triphosphatase
MKIITCSTNPAKIKAVKNAFDKVFPNESMEVIGAYAESGVSDQPMGDEETLAGAKNRIDNCITSNPGADFYVGLEGGCLFTVDDKLEAFAWMVVSDGKNQGKARTASFELPNEVARLVREGMELGHADDVVFQRKDSKTQNGAVGILTNDVIDRSSYYEQAIVLALIPFIHPDLFTNNLPLE